MRHVEPGSQSREPTLALRHGDLLAVSLLAAWSAATSASGRQRGASSRSRLNFLTISVAGT
jgi:hypothetical protein